MGDGDLKVRVVRAAQATPVCGPSTGCEESGDQAGRAASQDVLPPAPGSLDGRPTRAATLPAPPAPVVRSGQTDIAGLSASVGQRGRNRLLGGGPSVPDVCVGRYCFDRILT